MCFGDKNCLIFGLCILCTTETVLAMNRTRTQIVNEQTICERNCDQSTIQSSTDERLGLLVCCRRHKVASPIRGHRCPTEPRHLLFEMMGWLIVGASRSPPGQVPNRLEFGSSFSQSAGFFVLFLVDFSIIGGTLGSLVPTFDAQKRFGRPKVPQGAPPPK